MAWSWVKYVGTAAVLSGAALFGNVAGASVGNGNPAPQGVNTPQSVKLTGPTLSEAIAANSVAELQSPVPAVATPDQYARVRVRVGGWGGGWGGRYGGYRGGYHRPYYGGYRGGYYRPYYGGYGRGYGYGGYRGGYYGRGYYPRGGIYFGF